MVRSKEKKPKTVSSSIDDEELLQLEREEARELDFGKIRLSLIGLWKRKVEDYDKIRKDNLIKKFIIPNEANTAGTNVKPQMHESITHPSKSAFKKQYVITDLIYELWKNGMAMPLPRSEEAKKKLVAEAYNKLMILQNNPKKISVSQILPAREEKLKEQKPTALITVAELNDADEGYPLNINMVDGQMKITPGVARGLILESLRELMTKDVDARLVKLTTVQTLQSDACMKTKRITEKPCEISTLMLLDETSRAQLCDAV